MKTLMTITLIGALAASPLALAQTRVDQVEPFISAGTDYGISQFRSIEFDDVELEGWMNDWYVELDLNGDASIRKEERRKYQREPYGLSAQDVRNYLEAASAEGMHTVEEIKIDRRGEVDIEGEDASGRELELEFRKGKLEPTRIERDD